ncbi:MAG: 5-formyltetrahydrofolate cyclo-ligase [Oscillospiraceae bacterium]|nr:5-formyltetrahydrofolate cyclo-ligase [Oscillospiraceae bacterium]
MNKKELRAYVNARVAEITEDIRRAEDARIYENAVSLSCLQSAAKVFVYVGTDREVPTAKLIEKLLTDGKRVCVPLCRGKGEMDAVYISSLSVLSPGHYGILEPPEGGEKALPEELDAVIVPGVAFGKDGTRLGRGGGYYDRFLKKASNARKIALCRDAALFETVPVEQHDEKTDTVVSSRSIIELTKER